MEELFAGRGEDGFWVELDAFDFVAAMAEAHDDAVVGFGSDGQLAGERFALDDEGVIPRGGEWLCQIAENIFAVMMDFAGLAVKELWGTNNFAAECCADRLMAEADAKDWKFSRKPLY